ncbi:ATP-binding protein [Streptomyces nanshensis]|uniref:ATP-binding protein n=1 Tax=Streptomyces nanshensis TaxID=518642 RepID=UPI0009A03244|nr:ATP-binding protein [Streptomyces nanshensis]
MRRPGEFRPRPQCSSWAAREGTAPVPWRCAFVVPTEPGSVRLARQTAAARLTESGVPAGSVLADAALLVLSELVTNAVRHTADVSSSTRVAMTAEADRLSIAVGDRDRRTVDPAGAPATGGLGTVRELAAAFGGGVRVEPAMRGRGKTVVVWFLLADA